MPVVFSIPFLQKYVKEALHCWNGFLQSPVNGTWFTARLNVYVCSIYLYKLSKGVEVSQERLEVRV